MNPTYITINEAMQLTGLSHRTIQRHIASGALTSKKNKRGVRQIERVSLLKHSRAPLKKASRVELDCELIALLTEILELIPNHSVETISRKAMNRNRIKQLL